MKSAMEDLDMKLSIIRAAARFPNCIIANCECDSRNGEWKRGCNCMCHWLKMDELYGKDNWTMYDVRVEMKKGFDVI